MTSGPSAGVKGGRSLIEYVRAKRRETCPVCQLDPDLLSQVRSAGDKRIPQDVVLAWLAEDHGIVLSKDDLLTHRNGRHDA
jgi:hypothetical protein